MSRGDGQLLATAATSRPATFERGRAGLFLPPRPRARCPIPRGRRCPRGPLFSCLETFGMDSGGPPWHARLAREMNANREELRSF